MKYVQPRYRISALAGLLLVLGATPHPAVAQIADSATDFTGVQGARGWSYGYYAGPQNPGAFVAFPLYGVFAANFWSRTANQPGGYWLLMSAIGGHPSGTRGIAGRVAAEHWVVRRFHFVGGGEANLAGTLRKVVETCGNGVTGRIFINGVQVWAQSIAGNNTSGITYSFNFSFPPNSTIDWAIDPVLGDEECDYSVFSATLSRSCPADLNRDGQVDDADFVLFATSYNLLDCDDPSMPPDCPADLNNDHVVDDADFTIFATAYNELLCP